MYHMNPENQIKDSLESLNPNHIDRKSVIPCQEFRNGFNPDTDGFSVIGGFVLIVKSDAGRLLCSIIAPDTVLWELNNFDKFPLYVPLFDCLGDCRTFLNWGSPTLNEKDLRKYFLSDSYIDDFESLEFWIKNEYKIQSSTATDSRDFFKR